MGKVKAPASKIGRLTPNAPDRLPKEQGAMSRAGSHRSVTTVKFAQ